MRINFLLIAERFVNRITLLFNSITFSSHSKLKFRLLLREKNKQNKKKKSRELKINNMVEI